MKVRKTQAMAAQPSASRHAAWHGRPYTLPPPPREDDPTLRLATEILEEYRERARPTDADALAGSRRAAAPRAHADERVHDALDRSRRREAEPARSRGHTHGTTARQQRAVADGRTDGAQQQRVSLNILARELRLAECWIAECALARRQQHQAEELQDLLSARLAAAAAHASRDASNERAEL
eukprot:2576697-Prymnesium_polylepis.1